MHLGPFLIGSGQPTALRQACQLRRRYSPLAARGADVAVAAAVRVTWAASMYRNIWCASGFPSSVRLTGLSRIVDCRRLEHPLNYFCACATFVAPRQHVGGNDLQDVWVVIALPEVHAVSDLKAEYAHQLCRDRYLANTGDLYWSTRHGHVHDLNIFNSL